MLLVHSHSEPRGYKVFRSICCLSEIRFLQDSKSFYCSDILVGNRGSKLKQNGFEGGASRVGGFEDSELKVVEKIVSIVVGIGQESVEVVLECVSRIWKVSD